MPDAIELLRKLQVKPGARLLLIDAPARFAALHDVEGVTIVEAGQGVDAVLAFCANPVAVDAATRTALAGLAPDGLLWFAYRKGAAARQSGLSRDVGWEAVKSQGYDTVRSVSLDDEWTGLRFRQEALIKR